MGGILLALVLGAIPFEFGPTPWMFVDQIEGEPYQLRLGFSNDGTEAGLHYAYLTEDGAGGYTVSGNFDDLFSGEAALSVRYFKAAGLHFGASVDYGSDFARGSAVWDAVDATDYCSEFSEACAPEETPEVVTAIREMRQALETWAALILVGLGVLWGVLTWQVVLKGVGQSWSGS